MYQDFRPNFRQKVSGLETVSEIGTVNLYQLFQTFLIKLDYVFLSFNWLISIF